MALPFLKENFLLLEIRLLEIRLLVLLFPPLLKELDTEVGDELPDGEEGEEEK